MKSATTQHTLAQTMSFGAACVTIFLLTGSVTDPVNAPKLFILGGVAGAILFLLGYQIVQKDFQRNWFGFTVIAFFIWSLFSLIASSSPASQGIYGVYGRNTGFIAYTCLGVIAIGASQIRSRNQVQIVLYGFLVALGINAAYGLWVLIFGDFLGWQNIYGALLGTFGNPNFVSSFLGMGFSLVFALSIKANKALRWAYWLFIPLLAWEIKEADSLQGVVVATVGVGIVIYFWLRDKFASKIVSGTYLIVGIFLIANAIAGVLERGPLKQILSQPTVALREQYWIAAIKMANSHPIFGVGPDSYGDWYRRTRNPQALITPGPDTVTNTAHNVFLDILSSGGYPLLFLYALMTGFSALSLIHVAARSKNFDPVYVGICVLWVGYQAQSIISINQLGLAVWGWLLNGIAISYRLISHEASISELTTVTNKKKLKINKAQAVSPKLAAYIGLVIGGLLASPPLSADAKWRDVQITKQVNKLEPALRESYFSPTSSFRLAEAVQLLESSNLPHLAIKYARLGVKYNPDYFEAWRFLYFSTKATAEERIQAKQQMIRLDPLNKAWKELK